jgi:thioredoxin reductase
VNEKAYSMLHGAVARGIGTCNVIPILLATNFPGIFVAGDVRHGSIERVVSAVGAVGEGSIAIEVVRLYSDRF